VTARAYRTMSPTLPTPSPWPVEPPPQIPAERARVRDALRVLAYAIEQGWAIIRPTMVEVFAADLAPVERRWLLTGIGPTQTRTGLVPNRVTVEGTLIGRLIRVHLPMSAGAR
jgi:hypothetical protein